ncbi:hypothetical protein [Capybara microvirus Cap3_SP_344]|nr:hypothetical protein [Capybara microvirus Cap3_SP_344]
MLNKNHIIMKFKKLKHSVSVEMSATDFVDLDLAFICLMSQLDLSVLPTEEVSSLLKFYHLLQSNSPY